MDFVTRQMLKEGINSKAPDFKMPQRWHIFNKVCKNRKMIVIGCGNVLEECLRKRKLLPDVYYFCDNSDAKVGKKLKQVITVGDLKRCYAEKEIQSLNILSESDIKDYVFLICSTVYYKELYADIKRRGAEFIFCYYLMEKVKLGYKAHIIGLRTKQGYDKMLEENTGWNAYNIRMRKRFMNMRQYPINKNKVVFTSGGKGYLDHGRYITEEIIKEGLKWEIVWLVANPMIQVPHEVRLINIRDEEQVAYEMSTAKIWISNSELPLYVQKRKGQVYIETKHWTGVTLKKFYLDAKYVSRNKAQRRNWKYNGRMMDYIITGSRFDSDSCRRGFCPKGKCIELGSARTDILFFPDGAKEKIFQDYGLAQDAHIALYAPTYRYVWNGDKYLSVKAEYQLDYNRLKEALEQKFGGDWYIFVKLHPAIRELGAQIEGIDKVVDVSLREDTQELLASCDMIISDYSSIMFEPAYVKKPVFLFATDIENYLKTDYDMLLDIRSLPFPLAENNEQLFQLIKEFDYEDYKQQLEEFLAPFEIKEDGHARERVVEFLKTIINE